MKRSARTDPQCRSDLYSRGSTGNHTILSQSEDDLQRSRKCCSGAACHCKGAASARFCGHRVSFTTLANMCSLSASFAVTTNSSNLSFWMRIPSPDEDWLVLFEEAGGDCGGAFLNGAVVCKRWYRITGLPAICPIALHRTLCAFVLPSSGLLWEPSSDGMSAVRCPRQQRMIGTVTRIVKCTSVWGVRSFP